MRNLMHNQGKASKRTQKENNLMEGSKEVLNIHVNSEY